jgi:hypothetical protein
MGVSFCLSCPYTHHQMGSVERNIGTLLRLGYPYSPLQMFPFPYGTRPLKLPPISLTCFHPKSHIKNLPMNACSTYHPIINFSKYLAVNVSPSFVLIIPTNLLFDPPHVSSLVIAKITSGTNVFIFPLVKSILLAMLCSMKLTFPSKIPLLSSSPQLHPSLQLCLFLWFTGSSITYSHFISS